MLNCEVSSCFNFVTGGKLRGKVQVHLEGRRRPGGGLKSPSPSMFGGSAKLVVVGDFDEGK